MSDQYVYRVIREDGEAAWEGRGSDPFTDLGSARRRATKLTNDEKKSVWYRDDDYVPKKYKVQQSKVEWEDFQ